MKVLVTGNLGYIGPVLGRLLKEFFTSSTLTGLDSGLFSGCTTSLSRIGDTYYDCQLFKDVRDVVVGDLAGIDAVVHLAAVSNDPIGKDFEGATYEINLEASCAIARLCLQAGVGRFIFASSCSMYGAAGDHPKIEADKTSPLTAYAKSKIGVEECVRRELADGDIDVTFLRFATACGASDRLRLDLVLNDFVASAYKYHAISILSDGSPWRPLIDVSDMSKAIAWALTKQSSGSPLSINVGSNEWNFQVSQLAEMVSSRIPGTKVQINLDAPPDKRSYKVNFDLYKKLAPSFYPSKAINETIDELVGSIRQMHLPSSGFRETHFIRLNHLRSLLESNLLSSSLRWN